MPKIPEQGGKGEAVASRRNMFEEAVGAVVEGRTPVVYAIDPLLAALAHFDTSADLR